MIEIDTIFKYVQLVTESDFDFFIYLYLCIIINNGVSNSLYYYEWCYTV